MSELRYSNRCNPSLLLLLPPSGSGGDLDWRCDGVGDSLLLLLTPSSWFELETGTRAAWLCEFGA